jgi:hypothetical protein
VDQDAGAPFLSEMYVAVEVSFEFSFVVGIEIGRETRVELRFLHLDVYLSGY